MLGEFRKGTGRDCKGSPRILLYIFVIVWEWHFLFICNGLQGFRVKNFVFIAASVIVLFYPSFLCYFIKVVSRIKLSFGLWFSPFGVLFFLMGVCRYEKILAFLFLIFSYSVGVFS